MVDSYYFFCYLHYKIQKQRKTNIFDKQEIKEVFGRILTKGGIPRFMIPYIIKDMITAGLLKLINHKVGYQLLENPKEKEIKKLVYLESWN